MSIESVSQVEAVAIAQNAVEAARPYIYSDNAELINSNINTIGTSYFDTDSAMNVSPLPNDNVIFNIRNEQDETYDGVYIYLSSEAIGYKRIGDLPLVKAVSFDINEDKKAPSYKQVNDHISTRLDDRLPGLEQVEVTDSDNVLNPDYFPEANIGFVNDTGYNNTTDTNYRFSEPLYGLTIGQTYTALRENNLTDTTIFRFVTFFDNTDSVISGVSATNTFVVPANTSYAIMSAYASESTIGGVWTPSNLGLFLGASPSWSNYYNAEIRLKSTGAYLKKEDPKSIAFREDIPDVSDRPTTSEMNTAIGTAVADKPTNAEMNTAIGTAVADKPTNAEMNTAIENRLSAVEQQDIASESSNSINPDYFPEVNDGYVNSASAPTASTTYKYSEYIPVLADQDYTSKLKSKPSYLTVYRFVTFYDDQYNYLSAITSTGYQFTTPVNCAFVILTVFKEYSTLGGVWTPSDIGLFEGNSAVWEDWYAPSVTTTLKIKDSVNRDITSNKTLATLGDLANRPTTTEMNTAITTATEDLSAAETLTLDNADKILFVGCSYLEGFANLLGKDQVSKLSMFTDYILANSGVSGQRAIDAAERLRNDTTTWGITPSTFRPTYVWIGNNGNEYFPLEGQNLDLYAAQFELAKEVIEALGAQMIISTDHHTNNNVFIEANLKHIADELGVPYAGIGAVGQKIIGAYGTGLYDGFWSGSHPGTRLNAFIWQEWLYFLSQLPRPAKSIKIFRKRNSVAVANIQDLNYDTLLQRAELWKELLLGGRSINTGDGSEAYYDRLDEATEYDPNDENVVIGQNITYQTNNNEYAALIAGNSAAFDDYGLIELVIDKLNVESLTAKITGDAGVTFYIKDNGYSNYVVNRDYDLVFSVTESIYNAWAETEGTLFTSSLAATGAIQFEYTGKLKSYSMGAGWFLCFSASENISQSARTNDTAGTLVKVSDSTTTDVIELLGKYRYPYEYFAKMFKPKGQLEPVVSTYADGVHTLTITGSKYFQYDKVKIIAYKSGGFSLTNVEAEYTGGVPKQTKIKEIEQKIQGTELIASRGFDSAGTGWTLNGNPIYSIDESYRDYPLWGSSIYHLQLGNDATTGFPNVVSRTINLDTLGTNRKAFTKVRITVTARLFPFIYNPDLYVGQDWVTDTAQITNDSFDMAVLAVGLRTGNNPGAVLRKPLDIGWSEVVYETTLPPYEDSFILELWRDWEHELNTNFPLQVYDVSVQVL